MNKLVRIPGILLLFTLIVLPAAAQIGPRITGADTAATAHPFSPDAQITVTGAESATIEGSEPNHTCLTPASAGGYSVWFRTTLQPGILALSTVETTYGTAGGPSTDSVISVYRFND